MISTSTPMTARSCTISVIDGRLKQIPTQRKKRDVILRHLARQV